MRSSGQTVIQDDWCPCQKGNWDTWTHEREDHVKRPEKIRPGGTQPLPPSFQISGLRNRETMSFCCMPMCYTTMWAATENGHRDSSVHSTVRRAGHNPHPTPAS